MLFEPLEPRRLLAGVTLVTHGQTDLLLPGGVLADWVPAMAGAIEARLGEPVTQLAITVTEVAGQITASGLFFGPSPDATASGEIVGYIDWSSLAGGLLGLTTHGTGDVASAVTSLLLDATAIPGFGHALAELPIHLIGHSRGGSLVSEIARDLGQAGVWVDRMTTLDPHPRLGDAPAGVAQTVLFADNYYQLNTLFTAGEPLTGQAYNRELPVLNGGYSSNHSDVHLWYHGTIDTVGSAFDGDATLTDADRDTWYAADEQLGATTGFAFSRWIGGPRPIDGLHVGLGGLGTREAPNDLFATWPSIIAVELGIVEPFSVSSGSPVLIQYGVDDADSGTTITFVLDQDRNPYNNNDITVIGQALATASPGSSITIAEFAWDTTGIAAGRYFVSVRISDGMSTRIAYVQAPLFVDALPASAVRAAPGTSIFASAGADGATNVTARNIDGRPVIYQQRTANAPWTVLDLVGSSGSPEAIAEAVTWVDAKDGISYAAAPSAGGLILFTNSASGVWSFRNLTQEIPGATAIVDAPTVFQSIDGLVFVGGMNANGSLVLYQQTGTGTAASYQWMYSDLSRDHLSPQGLTTPTFVGGLVSYVTSWNGLNIAGLDPAGDILAVWWAPGMNLWRVDNLSVITGAPPMVGGLTPYLTPWGGINLAGVSGSSVTVSWWVPGRNWETSNLTQLFSGPSLQASSLTSYVTPWGGLNIAGLDGSGDLVVYWWAPGLSEWFVSSLTAVIGGGPAVTGTLTGIGAPTGIINILGADQSGNVLRYWWQPGGAWSVDDLTSLVAM